MYIFNNGAVFILVDKQETLKLDLLTLDIIFFSAKRGGKPEDKANFVALIRDLKNAFEKHNLLLTAAIGAAPDTIDVSYDIPMMYKYLDYVHVMCYDYHGKWDRKTGHNAPLHADPKESGQNLFLNVDYTIKYLEKKGADPAKTVLGVPFYGRAFMLKNPHDNVMGAKTESTSFRGPYTREDGFLGYNEVCEELMEQDNPWEQKWHEHHHAPYMHKHLKWVSYDNEESIRIKSHYAHDNHLAGVMVWSIDTDDFKGVCGGPKFPLLRTINNALYTRAQGLSKATTGANLALGSVFAAVIVAFLL